MQTRNFTYEYDLENLCVTAYHKRFISKRASSKPRRLIETRRLFEQCGVYYSHVVRDNNNNNNVKFTVCVNY